MKSKLSSREYLSAVAVAIWGIGFLFLPDGILTDRYHYYYGDEVMYDKINPILGFMYVSPGACLFVAIFFSIFFEEKIAPKMTFAFYLSITIIFVVFAIEKTEFLLSSILLSCSMLIVGYLLKSDTQNKI